MFGDKRGVTHLYDKIMEWAKKMEKVIKDFVPMPHQVHTCAELAKLKEDILIALADPGQGKTWSGILYANYLIEEKGFQQVYFSCYGDIPSLQIKAAVERVKPWFEWKLQFVPFEEFDEIVASGSDTAIIIDEADSFVENLRLMKVVGNKIRGLYELKGRHVTFFTATMSEKLEKSILRCLQRPWPKCRIKFKPVQTICGDIGDPYKILAIVEKNKDALLKAMELDMRSRTDRPILVFTIKDDDDQDLEDRLELFRLQ